MRPPPCLLLLLALAGLGAAERTLDEIFQRPFAADAPWNRSIPGNASFAAVPGIGGLGGSVNYAGRWSTAIHRATATDRSAHLYIHPWDLWDQLAAGTVLNAGNPAAVEDALRAASGDTMPFDANFYSTIVRSPPGPRTWPGGLRDIRSAWRNAIRVPSGATPSPDSDGHLAIMQPDGLMLECYAAVVCANGDVVCTMASFSDPAADGSGRENGRTASLVPNYAGQIRRGEIASGRIAHALACTAPAALLAPAAVTPAWAFDTNDGYSGTLPMGTLLALPPALDPAALGLSAQGLVLARAAADYGIYIVDRGGAGITIKAALDADDAVYPAMAADAATIVRHLAAVTAAPQVAIQPAVASVRAGEAVVFAATVTGVPLPTLQWLRDGVPIAGATGSSFSISAVVVGDDGAHVQVVASSAAGAATSADAVLRVAAGGSGSATTGGGGGGGGGACGRGALSLLLPCGLAAMGWRRRRPTR